MTSICSESQQIIQRVAEHDEAGKTKVKCRPKSISQSMQYVNKSE